MNDSISKSSTPINDKNQCSFTPNIKPFNVNISKTNNLNCNNDSGNKKYQSLIYLK